LFPGNRWHTADYPITSKIVWTACHQAAKRARLGDIHVAEGRSPTTPQGRTEFVHACGLEDSDHVAGGLFEGNPSVDYGKTADLDRVIASAGGTTREMPPLVLGEKTIERLKLLWPKARKK
jgi:hypothetical protein